MTKQQRKEKVKEIFEDQGIFLNDADMENLGLAIGDTLALLADDIEEKEPYATVTIGNYRDVAMSVQDSLNED